MQKTLPAFDNEYLESQFVSGVGVQKNPPSKGQLTRPGNEQ